MNRLILTSVLISSLATGPLFAAATGQASSDTESSAKPAATSNAVAEAISDMSGSDGCRQIKVGSGVGFVAQGTSTYKTSGNPTMTRISKRNAYVAAFTKAKKELGTTISGLDNQGKTRLAESVKAVSNDSGDLVNSSASSSEFVQQSMQAFLRGFSVYEVQDDTSNSVVRVAIVVTPKTLSAVNRVAPAMLETPNMEAAIAELRSELKKGVTPPVGGRFITTKSNGETAVIGFGSMVVRTAPEARAQQTLNSAATQGAVQRAHDALCGMLSGDQNIWAGGTGESTVEEVKSFDDSAKAGDPLETGSAKKLGEAREKCVNVMQSSNVYESVRRNKIPPGVVTSSFFSEDKGIAYGIAIYTPSGFAEATKAAAGMDLKQQDDLSAAARKLKATEDEKHAIAKGEHAAKLDGDIARVKAERAKTEANNRQKGDVSNSGASKVQRPTTEVPAGPSGSVTNPSDL